MIRSTELTVRNRVEAEQFVWEAPWACISIANTEGVFADIQRENRIGLLQLAFADITVPTPGYILFHDSHAHDILDFAGEVWGRASVLIVHCDAGISRSSAVAAALSRLRLATDGEFFDPPYDPNPFVYRTLREVASGRGDYNFDDSGDCP